MTDKIYSYLSLKGLPFATKGSQIVTRCVFSGCDEKTRHAGHLYIDLATGVYFCHKCEAKGNMVTFARYFEDDPAEHGFKDDFVHVGRVTLGKAKEIEATLSNEQVEAWHRALPENIRKWLHEERLISEITLIESKIGWDGTRVVIPIPSPEGLWIFPKFRQAPGNEDTGPKYQYPPGSNAALYGSHLLSEKSEVYICEGELDALVLRSKGLVAVSSTGGAKTFIKEWSSFFVNIPRVYVVFDLDDAGRKGALAIGKLIPHSRIVMLPEELGEHGDVTDFFKAGKDMEEFMLLVQQARTAKEIEEMGQRYTPQPPPNSPTDIVKWRRVVGRLFPECVAAAEVGVAVLLQLLINDVRNPFGLVYVDVPSAGKTITLNFFSELGELVYLTDHFTPASLVSHASNRKQEDLEKIDLLPRIRHRMLIVRDLAPLFAERQENRLKSLGVLTRVFDGEGYESDSGVHGKRGYKGDYTFMFLAGSTPIAPSVWKDMGTLGNRLFFLNMNAPDKSEEELADLLIQDDFKHKEQECRNVTRDLILSLWSRHKNGVVWNKKNDDPSIRRIITKCARLLAHLRALVSVWSDEEDGKQQHANVSIEKPTRINQLLYNLARAHAVACGRTTLTQEDLWPCIEVALNSAPINRIRLLNVLIEHEGTVNTGIVENAINCSNPTALRAIETLKILRIVDVHEIPDGVGRPEKIVTVTEPFSWFCQEECKELRELRNKSLSALL
jgi:hypothetical protein